MSNEEIGKKIEETAKMQAFGLGLGIVSGGLTGLSNTQRPLGMPAKTAIRVGEAAGVALRNGVGVSGAAAAGAAVLTSQAAVIGTAIVAAAPIVAGVAVVGTLGYAAYKFLNEDK